MNALIPNRSRQASRMFLRTFPSGLALLVLIASPGAVAATTEMPPVSAKTEECLLCHEMLNPGLVADWRASRHARVTPASALGRPELERRMSATEVPEELRDVAVGCYECHSQNPDAHRDNFDHEGVSINVIVSPNDCKTCHPTEADEYAGSKKAHAVGNLTLNPVYHQLVQTVTSVKAVQSGSVVRDGPAEAGNPEACLACHGTAVEVRGMKTVVLDGDEEIEVPDLANWPNHGVGRINPDGSLGACTACHPRHSFSLAVARQPFTCAQCHLAPDTPAWEVYRESKHGNIMLSLGSAWHWDTVPWKVGEDFKAPTCATCHNSLIADPSGEPLVARTHDFGARLWMRIFGLPYAHPQPRHGDTSIIRNADGLPLPTTFSGEPARSFLIDPDEQAARRQLMRRVCVSCHGTDFANQHFAQLDRAIGESDRMTRSATELLQHAWAQKRADPANPFDESIEMKWVQQWLFYATSVRYAAAMSGPDYATFKNGWWDLSANLLEMEKAADPEPPPGTP